MTTGEEVVVVAFISSSAVGTDVAFTDGRLITPKFGSLLLLLLLHFPAAQNPPTTAPATSMEFNISAANIMVIQKRRSDIMT